MTKFGDTRVDDYFWLREKDNPEVIEHLKAENAYTEAATRHLEGFREKLYKEILSRIKETDESVPYRYHGWWYYLREVEGLQYPIYCRRKGSMEAPEEVMLDVNELARGKAYAGVDLFEVSPDGNYLAYAADFTGYREYTAYVKDLRTGELLADRLERVDSMAWAGDSRTLFYTQQNAAKRPDRLLRHRLGQPKDALVWEEKDELFNLGVGTTRSGEWVVATSASKDTSEVRVVPAVQPLAPARVVARRRTGHEYYVDHHGGEFWIRTNDKGKNFRLVRAPLADPAPRNWKQVLPHRKAVMLEDVDLFKGFWVATERDDGVPRLRVTEFATGRHHHIDMPEAVYSTGPGTNEEFDTDLLRFVYQSYVTPAHDVRLRRGEAHAHAPQAAARPGRLRSPGIRLGPAHGPGEGRHEGARLPRVEEVAARRRPAAAAAVRLRLLRPPDGRALPLLAALPARPGHGLRHRARARRRRPRQALVRRRQAREEDEHLHRLHRGGRVPRRRRAGRPPTAW